MLTFVQAGDNRARRRTAPVAAGPDHYVERAIPAEHTEQGATQSEP
jgi:hypothetical protein